MYFNTFPKILYDFKNSDNRSTFTAIVKDVTHNVRFRRDLLANVTIYDEYDIIDGETPEIIAEKVYGNPEYHWIIMLANQTFDYRKDFPLDEPTLVKFIAQKYTNPYETREYVRDDGLIVDSDYPGAYPVSHDQWEREVNERKRRIKLISKDLINVILKNYKDLM